MDVKDESTVLSFDGTEMISIKHLHLIQPRKQIENLLHYEMKLRAT